MLPNDTGAKHRKVSVYFFKGETDVFECNLVKCYEATLAVTDYRDGLVDTETVYPLTSNVRKIVIEYLDNRARAHD